MKTHTNIIYIATAEKEAAGGVKIIYEHSQTINQLNIKDFSSQILHLKKKKSSKWKNSINKFLKIQSNSKYFGWQPEDLTVDTNYKANWFKNKIKVKKNLSFNKKNDFLVFPEIFAHLAKTICIKNKIPYGIFALNGYSLNPTNDYKNLEEVYKKAKFIISISDNITKCLKISFPGIKNNKIIKANISIDKNKFNLKIKKKKLITYMPRKIPDHSETIMFFLRKHISKKWKIQKIHGLKEKEVFKYFSQSKIFLSITKSEGLGMPPLEAAIAGNKVIGYTGEGGKEYWREPLFTEISSGDFLKFTKEILKFIKKGKKGKKFSLARNKLIKNFSYDLEKRNIKLMINKIKTFF